MKLLFIGLPGGFEWILIVLLIVLLFGGKKIPELMRGIGKGMKEFKKESKSEDMLDEGLRDEELRKKEQAQKGSK